MVKFVGFGGLATEQPYGLSGLGWLTVDIGEGSLFDFFFSFLLKLAPFLIYLVVEQLGIRPARYLKILNAD
jgi:hypothetical protein